MVVLLETIEPSIIIDILNGNLLNHFKAEYFVGIQKVDKVLFVDDGDVVPEHFLAYLE